MKLQFYVECASLLAKARMWGHVETMLRKALGEANKSDRSRRGCIMSTLNQVRVRS